MLAPAAQTPAAVCGDGHATRKRTRCDTARGRKVKVSSRRRKQRLARLWAKLKNRIALQNVEMRRQQQQLIADAKRAAKSLATKLGALKHERVQYHTQAEIEKRQLAEGWEKLQQAENALNQRLNGIGAKRKTSSDSRFRSRHRPPNCRLAAIPFAGRLRRWRPGLSMLAMPSFACILTIRNRRSPRHRWANAKSN